MPTNLYGPGDNYHPQNSHVIPALLRRFHEAKEKKLNSISVWGSGMPRREFLHVDDLAEASILIMNVDRSEYESHTVTMNSHLNVGTGTDLSIRELAELIGAVVGYRGAIEFDLSKPDGTPQKLLDVSKINALGWRAKKDLKEGLIETYKSYCQFEAEIR